MKDLLKGFVAGVGTCLALIIGIAASPTDSTVRGYLRGLVDSTASPPPLIQATNAAHTVTDTTLLRATTSSNTTLNVSGVATLGSVAGATTVGSVTGTFTTLTAGAVRTTNSFLGTNTSLEIITDAKGLVTGITIVP